MLLSAKDDWKKATAEDIDRAINGSITAGTLVKTTAKKSILNRLIYALDRSCEINEANLLMREIIYNLHREMDGLAPLKSLSGLEVQVFNIFVPKDNSGLSINELYIIESGQIVRLAELNIENDLFACRLKQYFLALCEEPIDF